MSNSSDPADSGVVYLQGRAFLRDSTGGLRPVFAGGDGTEDTSEEGGTETEDTSGDGEGEEKTKKGEGEEKTFTQKEVDAILGREKAKATRGKVKPEDFGFKSKEEMQAFIEAQKKKADEDKSEAERKLEEAIEEAKKTAKDEVLTTANKRLIKAEFKVAAIGYGIEPKALDDAFLLAQNLEDWDVEVDDDGVVTGLTKEFFDGLKKAKPFLVATNGGKGKKGDAGAGAGGGGGDDKGAQLEETYAALRNAR